MDIFDRCRKVVILERIFGMKVRNYPNWWINNAYEEFKKHDCTTSQYKRLIESKS